jgi:hypothetical protein
MTSQPRPTRLLFAALAIVGVGLLQIVEIVAVVAGPPPEGMGPCSVDLFGLRFPSNPDACYRPVGIAAVLAVAAILFGVALALRPSQIARLGAVVAAAAAVVAVPGVLSQFDVVTTTTIQVALLGAAVFLIVVPSGTSGSRTRRWWIRAVAACVVLGLLDQMFSGFLFDTKPGPQLSFFIIAASIAAAGWLGRRLEPGMAAA